MTFNVFSEKFLQLFRNDWTSLQQRTKVLGEINCCSWFDAVLLLKQSRKERDGERKKRFSQRYAHIVMTLRGAHTSSTPEQLAQSDPTDVLSEELGQTLEHLFGSCPDWLRPLTIPCTPGVAEQGLSEVVVPTNLRVMWATYETCIAYVGSEIDMDSRKMCALSHSM